MEWFSKHAHWLVPGGIGWVVGFIFAAICAQNVVKKTGHVVKMRWGHIDCYAAPGNGGIPSVQNSWWRRRFPQRNLRQRHKWRFGAKKTGQFKHTDRNIYKS